MSIFQTHSVAFAVRASSSAGPRRRVDRDVTPGRCGNLDYCSIGMQRVQVQVPVSQPFVCPECGNPLRPRRLSPDGPPVVLPALRIAILLGAMAASLGAGYTIGRVQHTVGRVVRTAADTADAGLTRAGAALGLADRPAAAVQPGPAPAALPNFVTERPFPVHAAAVSPPWRLAHETRFGQVTVDCALDAPAVHAACRITAIRGADAFSAQAVTWLQGLAVRYRPASHGGALADHRWRVVFEDASGAARHGGTAD